MIEADLPAGESVSPYRDVSTLRRRRGGLADEVAVYVRHLVLTGELKPGTKIDQEAIAAVLDVSRSPIREALVVLGQEGILEVTPRRGAFVAAITAADIIDHYELFGIVSGRAAAIAAETFDESAIAELADIQVRYANGTSEEMTQLNDEFHRMINRAAPRPTRWLVRLLVKSVPTSHYEFAEEWDAHAVEHHALILDAITAHDAEAARRAMEHHLRESGLAAADSLRRQGFWET